LLDGLSTSRLSFSSLPSLFLIFPLVYICPVFPDSRNCDRPFLWTLSHIALDARSYDIVGLKVNYLLVDSFVITSCCPVTPFNNLSIVSSSFLQPNPPSGLLYRTVT
jgi:hypothetical protein